MQMPWANEDHYSYKGEATHNCLGCRKMVPYSSWGPWCFKCNGVRMRRINKSMAQIARTVGDDEAAAELEANT